MAVVETNDTSKEVPAKKMKLKDAFYRSLEGKQAMVAWEDNMRSRLSENAEEIWVKTRFGPTYVVADGPKDKPPVIALHGWGTNGFIFIVSNAFTPVTDNFRTYTVDVIGQPGQSALQTPPVRSSGYADWIQDLMDGLGLEKAYFLGTSFGCWLILNYGIQNPDAVIAATLLCPAGMAKPRLDPTILYYFYKATYFPTNKNVQQFIKKIIFSPNSSVKKPIIDDLVAGFQIAFEHFQTNAELPYTMEEEQLNKFKAPTLVLIGQDDMLFPSQAVVDRSKKTLQNVVHAEVLPDTGHGMEEFEYVTNCIVEHFTGRRVTPFAEYKQIPMGLPAKGESA